MDARDAAGSAGAPRWGAFSYPAYRRYWFASVCRVFGMTFRFIGAGWLVAVELDQSPLWLGLVALASAIPTIILSIPAGAIADRVDSRRILLLDRSPVCRRASRRTRRSPAACRRRACESGGA